MAGGQCPLPMPNMSVCSLAPKRASAQTLLPNTPYTYKHLPPVQQEQERGRDGKREHDSALPGRSAPYTPQPNSVSVPHLPAPNCPLGTKHEQTGVTRSDQEQTGRENISNASPESSNLQQPNEFPAVYMENI
ncbi:hypothetical protein MHYP_G00354120 [Metynnis hypsauchen]